MDAVTLRQYETLSPFEIKNDLAKIATRSAHAAQVAYLNAGRGSPHIAHCRYSRTIFSLWTSIRSGTG